MGNETVIARKSEVQEGTRTRDGELIIGAIGGLLEEASSSGQDFDRASDGLVVDTRTSYVWDRVDHVDTLVATFAQPNPGDEVYEIFGETPVAKSSVSTRVFAVNGNYIRTFYFLRGESVSDSHRVGVVRQALGFGPTY